MNIDLVLKRLELIKEGKGIGTISDIEASIILNEIEILNQDIKTLLKENENKEKVIIKQDNIIKEVREYNEQIIEDIKDFYRPTKDIIYSGDSLIDIATQNLEILDKENI